VGSDHVCDAILQLELGMQSSLSLCPGAGSGGSSVGQAIRLWGHGKLTEVWVLAVWVWVWLAGGTLMVGSISMQGGVCVWSHHLQRYLLAAGWWQLGNVAEFIVAKGMVAALQRCVCG